MFLGHGSILLPLYSKMCVPIPAFEPAKNEERQVWERGPTQQGSIENMAALVSAPVLRMLDFARPCMYIWLRARIVAVIKL